MIPYESTLDLQSTQARERRESMHALVAELQALEARAQAASAGSHAAFERRGALLPRERVAALVDPGSPFLALATLAGYLMDDPDPATSIPGGSLIAGIGFVNGARCMVVATDAGIQAGAMTEAGNMKLMRSQEIALENRLPFIHLVESAGANLRKYRVDKFIRGGGIFYNLARLSAAGIPVITVVHGPSTAGGA